MHVINLISLSLKITVIKITRTKQGNPKTDVRITSKFLQSIRNRKFSTPIMLHRMCDRILTQGSKIPTLGAIKTTGIGATLR
jgi:hypothetical protein